MAMLNSKNSPDVGLDETAITTRERERAIFSSMGATAEATCAQRKHQKPVVPWEWKDWGIFLGWFNHQNIMVTQPKYHGDLNGERFFSDFKRWSPWSEASTLRRGSAMVPWPLFEKHRVDFDSCFVIGLEHCSSVWWCLIFLYPLVIKGRNIWDIPELMVETSLPMSDYWRAEG